MKFLDNHGEKILYITWGILFLIILIAGCDVRVKASDVTDSLQFPLTLEDAHSLNNWVSEVYPILSGDSDIQSLLSDDDYVFVPVDLSYYGYWDDWSYWNIMVEAVPVEDFSSFNSNNLISQTSLTANYITGKNCYLFKIWIDERGNYQPHISDFQTFIPNNRTYFGAHNSQSFYNFTFVSSYPILWNKDFYSSNDNLTLKFQQATSDLGHSVAPNLNNDNVDPNDLPDISDHRPTIPNPPTVDTSTPSTLLNSIFELLEWGFNALISSINGFISYIGDLLSYLTQLIINNIKNAIDNIYQNFANLFEPVLNGLVSLGQNISDKVDYITAPIDPSSISIGIQTTDLATDVTGYKTALTSFVGSFDSVSEPSTYKIPIHFENISMFSDVGIQYIDLGWLNSVKTLLRGFVACLVTYGVIISIFDSVPNYINGGGGEDD